VDVILGSIILATIIVLGSLITISNAQAGSPSIALLGVLGIIVGSMLALLVVVLRGLLRQASQLESDLAEVV
jgi:xanthosine utilization system XapX-like protein